MLSVEHRAQLIQEQSTEIPKAFIDAFPQNKPAFSSDLREIAALQTEFESALGIPHDPNDLLQTSYNPVIDRWHIEKFRRQGREGEVSYYIREMKRNWEKNLRERLKTSESFIRYGIIGNKLFSQDFQDEPFVKILERGAEYRLRHGTPESEREGMMGEIAGFKKIQEKLADTLHTKKGTKMTSFSPHGIAEDSAYEGDFIDEFELVYDGKDVFVRLTRTAVDLDYEGYKRLALELDPNYFDDYDGRPIDAWYLSHPVEAAISEVKKKGILNDFFEKIWKHPLLQGLIGEYIKEITAEKVNWWAVAEVFNTILNQADKREVQLPNIPVRREDIQRAKYAMGRQTPRQVSGGGCPTNKGYNLSGQNPLERLQQTLEEKYGGSVAKFAEGKRGCDCPDKSDNHYHCPSCEKKYADETHKEERTKECSCGFKFNC